MKKLMIVSDIHGSAFWCRQVLERFAEEGAERLLLLGDILYHGPRNELPAGYSPKEVAAMLNAMRDKLLCVRGNCDAEVDQMVLDFPIMADYAVLSLGRRTVYASHGHLFSEQAPPPLLDGDIFLYGHTHIPVCRQHEHFIAMNPGSASLPKEGSAHGYIVWEKDCFYWKDIEKGTCFLKFEG